MLNWFGHQCPDPRQINNFKVNYSIPACKGSACHLQIVEEFKGVLFLVSILLMDYVFYKFRSIYGGKMIFFNNMVQFYILITKIDKILKNY